MAFFQEPPRLANQFDDDPLLPSWIARFVPAVGDELRAVGELAVDMYAKQLADLVKDHKKATDVNVSGTLAADGVNVQVTSCSEGDHKKK